MSTYTGLKAETEAVNYLKQRGYSVVTRNWRTRHCEIDIVAQKDDVIHFVEVKYRHSTSQGTGLDYITSVKLQQMQFAAEFWVAEHEWGGDYRLAAIEVTGGDFVITSFIDSL